MYKSIKPKKTISENIKDFSFHKKLCEMKKPRSPISVMFVEDAEDSWFIHVKHYKTKSGEITNSSMIILPDYETWVSHIESSGFNKLT